MINEEEREMCDTFPRKMVSGENARNIFSIVLRLIVASALGACEHRPSLEKAESQLRYTGKGVAADLAEFRWTEGCYPHAKAGLKLVLSENCFQTFKNPDGSFTAALPNYGVNPMKAGECYYLNPAKGSLADPSVKVVLVVLVQKEYGLTLVIDSSCAGYLLRSDSSRNPRALLGKPVSELESTGSLANSFPAPAIVSDKPSAPWRPTCSRPEHLPWWCE
jgi:hypothetical protein